MPRRLLLTAVTAAAGACLVVGATAHPAVLATSEGADALHTAGIAGSRVPVRGVIAIRPGQASGHYLGDTSLLQRSDGRLVTGRAGPKWVAKPEGFGAPVVISPEGRLDPEELIAAPAWLAGGTVPGRHGAQRDMARRALLDLRLLTDDAGATIAAPTGAWRYVWPRDASWVAAAFAATGHPDDAESVLRFLARMQRGDGRWEARYMADPSRPRVPDARRAQLDGVGWVPWAVWFAAQYRSDPRELLAAFWPTIASAADAAARSLRHDGLPAPSPDWWETGPVRTTIGTAAALLAGLRCAAAAASSLGRPVEAARWGTAARRLGDGIERVFAARGFPRSPGAPGADPALAWLAPPFGPYDAGLEQAMIRTRSELTTPAGAVTPGSTFPKDDTIGWTAPLAFFTLADAASGRAARAGQVIDWLAAHRTELGALPERVDARGRPSSVAPLGWTAAAVLLAMTALETPLPVPPVEPRVTASVTGGVG